MPPLVRGILIWTALFGTVVLSLYLPWFWWNVLVITLLVIVGVCAVLAVNIEHSIRRGKRPWVERVWFWKPSWYWFGPRTLVPFATGSDEWGWHTIVLGWTVTGRIIIAWRKCPRTGKCAPDADPDFDYVESEWPADPYPDHSFDENPYPGLAYYRSLPQYQRDD